jgi:hypothetical protein
MDRHPASETTMKNSFSTTALSPTKPTPDIYAAALAETGDNSAGINQAGEQETRL